MNATTDETAWRSIQPYAIPSLNFSDGLKIVYSVGATFRFEVNSSQNRRQPFLVKLYRSEVPGPFLGLGKISFDNLSYPVLLSLLDRGTTHSYVAVLDSNMISNGTIAGPGFTVMEGSRHGQPTLIFPHPDYHKWAHLHGYLIPAATYVVVGSRTYIVEPSKPPIQQVIVRLPPSQPGQPEPEVFLRWCDRLNKKDMAFSEIESIGSSTNDRYSLRILISEGKPSLVDNICCRRFFVNTGQT